MSLITSILNTSRLNKQIILFIVDSFLLITGLLLAFSIRLGYWFLPSIELYWVIFGAPIIAFPIFISFRLYKALIRYIGLKYLWNVFQAITTYSLLWGIIVFMFMSDTSTFGIQGIPRSVIVINWFTSLILIGGNRLFIHWLVSGSKKKFNDNITNVVIFGAGSAGRQLSIALKESSEFNPLAFVDDDKDLHKQSINGIKVLSRNRLETYVNKNNVSEVLLAMPLISRSQRKSIINFLEPFPVIVRSLPSVTELARGKIKIADLREISIKDLLGREAVDTNEKLLNFNIVDKVVMITGAGGSIGSELCRQILSLKPKILICYDQSEISLYNIDKELRSRNHSSCKFVSVLGSINNQSRLNYLMKLYKVQTIYHSAAYKHVPLVEDNIAEGVNNNVLGTLTCAESAIKNKVETFVLISTDKAVRPTNIMGASKRCSEMVLQALSHREFKKNNKIANKTTYENLSTNFSIVRFGNVLNSSGSVIPLFKEQIKNGGPVTVTHSEIIRYFMTIPEAVELVIQAGAMGANGDIFVLDMGEPVKIYDLAKKMIHLSGFEIKDEDNPEGDIEIEFTGLRPGEKLYEELLIGDDISETVNPKIMRAKEKMLYWIDLKEIVEEMRTSINSGDYEKIKELLVKAVPEFNHNNKSAN